MAFLSSQSQIGLAKEVTRGTALSPTVWLPISQPQVSPNVRWLRDEALRGSAVTLYDQIAGVRHDEYDFRSHLFSDTSGNFFLAALGNAAAPTGSASVGYTHVIGLAKDATGSQPPSYTLTDFDGANAFQIAGAQMSEMTLTTAADGDLELSTKYVGNPYTVLTSGQWTALTPSYSSQVPFVPSWNVAATVNGAAATYVAESEVKIDRKSAPIFTQGTQAPLRNFAGPVEVSGRIMIVLENANDPFTAPSSGTGSALSRTQGSLTLVYTNPNAIAGSGSTAQSITLQMSDVQWHDPKRNRGKSYVEIELQYDAHANTTDQVAGGYSPLKVSVLNNQSTAY